jgi:hypothetical protein
MASSLNSCLLFKREYQEPSQSPNLIKAVEGHYLNLAALAKIRYTVSIHATWGQS